MYLTNVSSFEPSLLGPPCQITPLSYNPTWETTLYLHGQWRPLPVQLRQGERAVTTMVAAAMRDAVSSIATIPIEGGFISTKVLHIPLKASQQLNWADCDTDTLVNNFTSSRGKIDLLWEQKACTNPIQVKKKGGRQRGLWEIVKNILTVITATNFSCSTCIASLTGGRS